MFCFWSEVSISIDKIWKTGCDRMLTFTKIYFAITILSNFNTGLIRCLLYYSFRITFNLYMD